MAAYNVQKVLSVHHWTDAYFTFTCTRDDSLRFENGQFVMVGLMVDGKPPKVEIIDPLTIKYTWEKPNPYFIESQARAAPLFLFRPAHYLKKFHTKYTPEAEILKAAKGGQQNWVQV